MENGEWIIDNGELGVENGEWKKRRIPIVKFVAFMVGATRLERATAWSQTRSATNCATPRFRFAVAKVDISHEPRNIFRNKI